MREAVKAAANKVARGKALAPDIASAMAKAKHAKARRAGDYAEKRWKSRAMAERREEMLVIWRSMPMQAAFDAMPKDVRDDLGSLATARRVFKNNGRKPTKQR